MTGTQSEIIILIDTSSFRDSGWKTELIEHVKEAVSFQISRGAITNRKLIRLGLEPYLGRVKWTHIFFDSTHTPSPTCSNTEETDDRKGNPLMKKLSYECWDLFEAELNRQVRSQSTPEDTHVPERGRIQNVITVLENLKFPYNWGNGLHNSDPDLTSSSGLGESQQQQRQRSVEKIIIVFTVVPKIFSCLVHLAAGITQCKYSLSLAANCSPADIQVCFVDVTFDSVSLQEHGGGMGRLPSFWDDISSIKVDTHSSTPPVPDPPQQCQRPPSEMTTPGGKINLRVFCLKKIMMIHKLKEMRFPWMYDQSLPFGFGMGMKRLRQWEWRIPQKIPALPATRRRGCLSLRKCYSEEADSEPLL